MTTPAPTTVTSPQIAQLRLQALGLAPAAAQPALQTPLDVVRHHLAMQAQDFKASRWAIGSRLGGCVEADVLRAYDDGQIVRSWPMRGTVHAVVAEDLPWMLELMGQRALAGVQRRWQMLGIDEPFLERARDVTVQLLRGGGRCTRAELGQALEAAGLELNGQRAYHAVWYLSQTGTLVQGPTQGADHQLVLLDEWIQKPRKLSRDEALGELGRRYLTARGPATVDDLVHWTRLTKGDCRKAFEANAEDLVELDRTGAGYVMLREQFERFDAGEQIAPPMNAPVLALAAFDEHLLGYRVRDDVLDPAYASLVDPARNGVFRWTIVIGGRVVATWKRTPRTKYVRVEVAPFKSIPNRQHAAVGAAIQRWADFAGVAAKTEIS